MSGIAASTAMEHLVTTGSTELAESVTTTQWIGDAFFVGTADGLARRYDTTDGHTYEIAIHHSGITCIRPRPDGQMVASAGEDGRVLLWDPLTGDLKQELSKQSSWVEHLSWSSDGKTLAAAAEKTVLLWRDGESLGTWYDARRRVLAMAWAPDGKRLATAANKGLFLWRTGGDEAVQLLEFPGAPVSVAWDASGSSLAVGTQDGFLQLWQQTKNQPARQLTMRGYPGKVNCLDWDPRRAVIASAGGPDIVLWESQGKANSRKGHPLRCHQETVTALCYAPDSSVLASGDRTGRLCLWDPKGSLLHVEELGSEISVISWSHDSQRFVCGTIDGLLQTYELRGRKTQLDS